MFAISQHIWHQATVIVIPNGYVECAWSPAKTIEAKTLRAGDMGRCSAFADESWCHRCTQFQLGLPCAWLWKLLSHPGSLLLSERHSVLQRDLQKPNVLLDKLSLFLWLVGQCFSMSQHVFFESSRQVKKEKLRRRANASRMWYTPWSMQREQPRRNCS